MMTQDCLKRLLSYDKDTGNLIWDHCNAAWKARGKVAGSPDPAGYLRTTIAGKRYSNHRLVWMIHYGYFPEYVIDHIDNDKTNNRIENLREVSMACNMKNIKNYRSNTSGVKGVSWSRHDNRWYVHISINRKQTFVGSSKCFAEAAAIRLSVEQCIGTDKMLKHTTAYNFIHNIK